MLVNQHTGSSGRQCARSFTHSPLQFALEVARLRMSAIAPAISAVLLLLAALASAAAAADAPVKKVGMRFVRPANEEEARWLQDRYAGTHQQLGAGPIRMRRATAEEAKWPDRMSGNAGTAGESGGGDDGCDDYIEFDDDNPYVEAVRAWVSRLAKRITLEDAQAENPFRDL
ncbi:hypothetical protein PAHAL_3G362400 [Panicum hallii]|uniref:Uncharacterized protein n=1 Tax=Panicum hallii TaxID=206008 RepID=A0A2S3HDA5_9POAL|nr:hypothetical protein PAHAL_3G362400 [Panicum hallii]